MKDQELKMNVPKSWEDQPNEVLDVPVILSVSIPSGVAEIRMFPGSLGGACYLTCGTLFGSQTVACDDLEVAVRALNRIANRTSHRNSSELPSGAKLIANADADAGRHRDD